MYAEIRIGCRALSWLRGLVISHDHERRGGHGSIPPDPPPYSTGRTADEWTSITASLYCFASTLFHGHSFVYTKLDKKYSNTRIHNSTP